MLIKNFNVLRDLLFQSSSSLGIKYFLAILWKLQSSQLGIVMFYDQLF